MEQKFRPVLSVRIFGGEAKCFGPGVAELLRRVEEHHSLRAAANSMCMAYSKAWTVIKNAENAPIADRKTFTLSDGRTVNVFPCIQGGTLTGVALEQFGSGYGGDLGVVVGFRIQEDTLAGIGITTMKETAGVGTKVKEPSFLKQFPGKSLPVQLRSQGGEIDAISGATVSSNGVITAVDKAVAIYKELKPLLLETWK